MSETSSTPVGESLQRDDSGTWQGPLDETFGACNSGLAPPPAPTLPPTRIAELHYDNSGTDTGEAVEVEGPAGSSVDGWSVVLYNGNGGGSYNTTTLSGTIPASCGARGVVVVNYPSNGIQNGSPDGLALVDAGGSVVEFLSYEGTFAATDGAASGMTSTDIGVSESSSTAVGESLQRDSTGAWEGPLAQSFGACNGMAPPPPPPPSDAPIVIDELMADPLHAAGGASWGEWFEVHNAGTDAIDLEGWTIASAGQPNHVIASSVVVPAGGYAVLGRGYDPASNGGITLDYNYYAGSSTIWLDDADNLVLRDTLGALVDSVSWTSGTMAKGVTRALRDADTPQADVDGGAWGYSTTPFGDGDLGTPGAANGTLADTPPPLPSYITFSGRTSSDPALPVGFEDQLFATLHDGTGASVATTFTWSAVTPDVAT
ncbi:MAG: lamin tail domain-containing protein, partial [Gemmatimonadota bacterium]